MPACQAKRRGIRLGEIDEGLRGIPGLDAVVEPPRGTKRLADRAQGILEEVCWPTNTVEYAADDPDDRLDIGLGGAATHPRNVARLTYDLGIELGGADIAVDQAL